MPKPQPQAGEPFPASPIPSAPYIIELARTFPSLKLRLRNWPENKPFCADRFHERLMGAKEGAYHAGMFILHVWNREYALTRGWLFNLGAFVETAAPGDLAAFAAWAANPKAGESDPPQAASAPCQQAAEEINWRPSPSSLWDRVNEELIRWAAQNEPSPLPAYGQVRHIIDTQVADWLHSEFKKIESADGRENAKYHQMIPSYLEDEPQPPELDIEAKIELGRLYFAWARQCFASAMSLFKEVEWKQSPAYARITAPVK